MLSTFSPRARFRELAQARSPHSDETIELCLEAPNLGPFTRHGLNSLRGLDGLAGLSFFWHTSRLRGDDLQGLDGLSNLAYLGCQDALCDDDAMRHIAGCQSFAC